LAVEIASDVLNLLGAILAAIPMTYFSGNIVPLGDARNHVLACRLPNGRLPLSKSRMAFATVDLVA
jgi:hypothetical protein